MAKLRHIAFISKEPKRLSDFYQQVFGFEEARVFPSGSRMVVDGLFNLAFLQQNKGEAAVVGTHRADGSEADQRQGINHYGFVVDDLEGALAKLPPSLRRGNSPQISAGVEAPRPAEVRFIDPWGNKVDLSSKGFLGREEEKLPGVRLVVVQVPDPDEGSAFYTSQFDLWEISRGPDGAIVLTDGTVSLALTKTPTLPKAGIQYFGLQVEDLEVITERLRDAGVSVSPVDGELGEIQMSDPEGNRVVLSAKGWAA